MHLIREREFSIGWLNWYWIFQKPEMNLEILVGHGGFNGSPNRNGVINLTYSLLLQFKGQSIATEAIAPLLSRAMYVPEVKKIETNVATENKSSIKMLKYYKFRPVKEENNSLLYVRDV